jgi:hypothetical protein
LAIDINVRASIDAAGPRAPGDIRRALERQLALARGRVSAPAATPGASMCFGGMSLVGSLACAAARMRVARLRRCPVCHASVGRDDAVGLFGGRVAHAECALLRWLGSYEQLRQLVTEA